VARFLVILVLAAIAVAFLWPTLIRLKRGRIVENAGRERRRGTFFVPIAVCVALSFLISTALWWFGH
jgi:hypothetical protein